MRKLFFHNKRRGFTLIELVVVASIMSAIMLLVTFNSRKFNNDLAVQTAAGEVSLAMRQAQSFGVSVKQSQAGGTDFNKPYGIVFDLQAPTNFYIYADVDQDRAYDGGSTCTGSDECRDKSTLRGGVSVGLLCGTYAGGTLDCFSSQVRYLVITYVRPNPEPIIKAFRSDNTEIVSGLGPLKTAYIRLVGSGGQLTYVVTDANSGQIVIQNTMP